MHILAAERERRRGLAETVDNPVARDNSRLRIYVQGIADHARPARIARKRRHLTVGCNAAARNSSDNIIDQLECSFHIITRNYFNLSYGKNAIKKDGCDQIRYRLKRKQPPYWKAEFINVGVDLSSREAALRVLSARMSLTTVFGMGTGGPSSS